MFGAHLPELLIVLVLALVVFGPKRLPEIGGALGKSIREFRDGTSDLKNKATGQDDATTAQIPTRSPDSTGPVSPVPGDEVATTPPARTRDTHVG
ncbi:MAG: hypothetical protein NVSMB22_02370 [Chloroflexota bacterium]